MFVQRKFSTSEIFVNIRYINNYCIIQLEKGNKARQVLKLRIAGAYKSFKRNDIATTPSKNQNYGKWYGQKNVAFVNVFISFHVYVSEELYLATGKSALV